MKETFTILKTNRSEYNIKEAAVQSITVRELIDYLRDNADLDSRIVFSNDDGYTYGYITERVVGEQFYEEEVEEDDELTRQDMVDDIVRAIEKNGGQPIPVRVVWLARYDDREVLTAGYQDGVLGVTLEDSEFLPLDDLSDYEVDCVWFEGTQIRR